MKKDIAIVVLNYIQYINIIPAIKELIIKGHSVDFYCPHLETKDGFNDMFDDIKTFLKKEGYNVYDKTQPFKYKVLLEPYPEPAFDIKAKYQIKYRYSNISAKPSVVYNPEKYVKYDCVLCSGNYDSNYLNAYTKTYKTGNMKYINFKKKKNKKTKKKTLLYLPTYGDGCSIDDIYEELKEIKKEYYIIAKIHHGTTFLKNEYERIEKIKINVDEFYDCHKDLNELLEITDIVLTDNSGSIFEAIYTEIPVAIYCDDINKFKLENFNTTQYELVKNKIIPYTNDKNKILQILKDAQSDKYYLKQKEWNRENFYHPRDLKKDFVNIIETYLNNEINHRYFEMHNVLKKEYYNNIRTIQYLNLEKTNILKEKNEKLNRLKANINNLNIELKNKQEKLNKLTEKNMKVQEELSKKKEEIKFLNKKIYFYETGLLYKIAKKIYEIKNRRSK